MGWGGGGLCGIMVNIQTHAKCEIAFRAKREREREIKCPGGKPISRDRLDSFGADVVLHVDPSQFTTPIKR